jgi:hypothetical protein
VWRQGDQGWGGGGEPCVAKSGGGGSGVEHGGRGDRHRQRWRRPVCRAAVARRPRAGTLEFWNESQTTRGGLLFIGSKISEADLN